jgi:hypothetical protein
VNALATSRIVLIGAALVFGGASCGDSGSSSGGGSASCGSKEVAVQAGGGAAAPPTLPPDDDALVAAVADAFCSTFVYKLPDGKTSTAPPALSSRGEAACIGSRLVRELGADRVRQLGLGTNGWGLLGFGLSNHRSIDRPEAEKIVDTFQGCSKSWKLLMIKSITQGTDKISDASARCTSERLADSDARAIFAGELDRAYDEQAAAEPFFESVKPLMTAMEHCLKPDELEGLDWD